MAKKGTDRKNKKTVELFPCVYMPENTWPYVLHAIKELTFKIENTSWCGEHIHDNYFEIIIVVKGKLHSVINETAGIGYAALIVPGDTHFFLPAEDKKARIINLTCQTQTAEKIANDLFGRNITDTKSFSITLNEKQMKLIDMFSLSVLSANEDTIDGLTTSFFSHMLGLFFTFKKNDFSMENFPEWLKDFINKVNSLELQEINMSELYKISGYSQSRFSVLFRKYMGMSLLQYINNLRLEYACSMLSKTNHKIIYISNKVGFPSISRFNTQFKKKYGVTPVEYRKQFPINNS